MLAWWQTLSVFFIELMFSHLLVSAHRPSSPSMSASTSTSREYGGQSIMFDNMSKGACPRVSQLRQELRAGQGQTGWTDRRTKDIISTIIVIFMSYEETSAHLVCCCGTETMERMKRSVARTRWDWRRAEGRRHFQTDWSHYETETCPETLETERWGPSGTDSDIKFSVSQQLLLCLCSIYLEGTPPAAWGSEAQ